MPKKKRDLQEALLADQHAAMSELASEEWVNATATDIARVLWRLGYRKQSR